MTPLSALPGRARRRHARLLRRVLSGAPVFVRGECSFRMAERLHRAGLLVAQPSKWAWAGGRRPFRELELRRPGDARPDLPRMPA